MKTKSALSYFGSDSEVAENLAAMLENCKHVTIPFVGGASILPHLKARAIVCNDLNGAAINFYKVASGVYGDANRIQLFYLCQKTLSHPDEMRIAEETLKTGAGSTVELAWAYWAKCWIGRKGKGGTKNAGGSPSIRRTPEGGTNATRIRAAADDLVDWARHFERCEWESTECWNVFPRIADNSVCGVYCDPPWVGAGRNYLHGFDDTDHKELARCLQRFENATVVIRYGDDPFIRELYAGENWRIVDAFSRTQSNKSIGEIWITNK